MRNHKLSIKITPYTNHQKLLEHLSLFFESERGDSITIDLDFMSCSFVYPDFLLLIASAMEYSRNKGVQLSGQVFIRDENANYASRMNFFELVRLKFNENFNRRSSKGKFIEITNVTSENNFSVAHKITEMLVVNSCIDKTILAALDYCIGEILSNIDTHAHSSNGGWVVAQYFQKKNCIRIMICDTGIGIKASLTNNPQYSSWNESKCLKECIVNSVTSGEGMGYGLYFTSSFVEHNRGELMICSGKHLLRKDPFNVTIKKSNNWQGTIVYLKINTNIPVNPELVGTGMTDYLEYYKERFEENDIDNLW